MLIAQITDLHIGFGGDDPDELNRRRLALVLSRLAGMVPLPDLLLATGDLADTGDDALSYPRLRAALAGLPFPVHFALGNHDSRGPFRAAFPEVPFIAGGFVQYEVEGYPLRILVLDTLEEGRHGGGFCEIRAEWLRARLAEQSDRPTLLVLHHPPIDSGLSWMTENPAAAWVLRLEAIVAEHRNIVGMIAGHLHRPLVTGWAGTTLAVCASTAPQVALDLAPIDPNAPDGRAMIVADPPAFALHWWNGRNLVSHFDDGGEHPVIARFGQELQPLVAMLVAEQLRP